MGASTDQLKNAILAVVPNAGGNLPLRDLYETLGAHGYSPSEVSGVFWQLMRERQIELTDDRHVGRPVPDHSLVG